MWIQSWDDAVINGSNLVCLVISIFCSTERKERKTAHDFLCAGGAATITPACNQWACAAAKNTDKTENTTDSENTDETEDSDETEPRRV